MLSLHYMKLVQWTLVFPIWILSCSGGVGQEKMAMWAELSYCFPFIIISNDHWPYKMSEWVWKTLQAWEELGSTPIFPLLLHVCFLTTWHLNLQILVITVLLSDSFHWTTTTFICMYACASRRLLTLFNPDQMPVLEWLTQPFLLHFQWYPKNPRHVPPSIRI